VQADHAIGEAESTAVRQTLEALKTEISRATRTTNQLLALARSDTAALNWLQFDLALLVREVVLTHLAQARKKNIDLGMDVTQPERKIPIAVGDRVLLREALVNLVSNAMTYCQAGGEITVMYVSNDGTWSLGVMDNGPGISDIDRAQLGERFVRTDKTHSTGSGLGLAIARSIAEKHGGALHLEQRPDQERGLHARISWTRNARM
ncbi:MAG: HAMP domain-containing histidine kinase, partial [Burkholderiaceae bacterium]|nr:HAMP domain-containing histidine kinase [Burkholderiaceae bacterium]